MKFSKRNSVLLALFIPLFIYTSFSVHDILFGHHPVRSGRYAVISLDLDTNLDFYLFYLPITCMSWRLINFEPIVLAVVSDSTYSNKLVQKTIEYLDLLRFKIVVLKTVPDYSKMTGMLARLFIGLVDRLSDDDFIFQSDADLLPINKTYYNKFDNTNSIKHFDVSSFQTPIGSFDWKGRHFQMYFMGHIGMTKRQWRELMHFNEPSKYKLNGQSIIDLVKEYFDDKRIKKNADIHRGDDVWFLDQFIVSINIARYLDNPNNKMYKNPSHGIKLDRIWPNDKWLNTLLTKYEAINDVHLYHGDYLLKMNFLDLLLKKMFPKGTKLILDKYIQEFIKIKQNKKIK